MKISIIGCGRWGSFHAWHASKIGHDVILYGRENSAHMQQLESTGGNEYLQLPENIRLTKNLSEAVNFSDIILISVGTQNFRELLREIKSLQIDLSEKNFILCMKGLENSTGKRLSVVFDEEINSAPSIDDKPIERNGITNEKLDEVTATFSENISDLNEFNDKITLKDGDENPNLIFSTVPNISQKNISCAVWVGPGHVQDFVKDIPNCMVISSADESFTHKVVEIFKSPLIRFYYSNDLIGTEIGAAAKNVIGIAAGMLDGLNFSSLKGALMARGTSELSRLIESLGGDKMTVYGLSHLGDYEATLFSSHSRNRKFGEDFIANKKFEKLAEGVETVAALMKLSEITGVDLPICHAVYKIIYENKNPKEQLTELFMRSTKSE